MKRQQGFTLIELVVVIVVLGVLAAVALPRFMNATEDAHTAAVKGTGGALAAGVALVRSQWELNRAKGVATPHTNVAGFGNGLVDVDATTGWPLGLSATLNCIEVWDNVMQGSAPRVAAAAASGIDYVMTSDGTTCTYTYSLDGRTTGQRTIAYNSSNGVVTTSAN